jgi:hypothetical protein
MALGEAATLTVRGDKVCTTFGASHNIGPTHKRPVSLCLFASHPVLTGVRPKWLPRLGHWPQCYAHL